MILYDGGEADRISADYREAEYIAAVRRRTV